MHLFHQQLRRLSREWIDHGLPSRGQLLKTAQELTQTKQQQGIIGLWAAPPPRLLTATLDDGIGQGIEIINLYAGVMGMEVIALGLMQEPDAILTAARQYLPRYVGLTVLQMDTEDVLALVGHQLPPDICLIAGGPAFRYDPDMAPRCGVRFTAANVAFFIDILLNENPVDS